MSSSRNQRRQRTSGTHLYLVRKVGAHAPSVIGPISYSEGETRVSRGKALRVRDELGVLIGYQLLEFSRPDVVDSSPSSCVLSRKEMDLLAGVAFRHGRSHTEGMTEKQRSERATLVNRKTLKYQPEMDAVELACIKQACFTAPVSVQGDRAVRVYPRSK